MNMDEPLPDISPPLRADQLGFPTFRMRRELVEVAPIHAPSSDLEYWLSRTPEERLAAVEFLRQVFYGYDPVADRIPRVLTVHELGEG